MIPKSDILLLLTELENKGVDVKEDITKTLSSNSISLDTLRKINKYNTLDIVNFYDKIRKSYNNKKSKLFINIMRADEGVLDNDPKTVLTTLTGLLNQILQYQPENRTMFYTHMRCDEIVKVLNEYFRTYNLNPSLQLLKLFKADEKVIEMIK